MTYYFQKEMIRLFNRDTVKFECERRNIHQIKPTIAPAIIYGEITSGDLAESLPSTYELDGKMYYTRRYLLDTKYLLTSIAEIKRFLKWNLVDKDNYVIDAYDCDNFSISLHADCLRWTPGLALGQMHVPGHAINMVTTLENGVKKNWHIEPQSDVVRELTPDIKVTFYLI